MSGNTETISGTVQVAGNRTIDKDAAIKDWFGTAPTIGVGKKLIVEGNAAGRFRARLRRLTDGIDGCDTVFGASWTNQHKKYQHGDK